MTKDIYNEVLTNLRSKYKKQALTLKETSIELSISVASLTRGVKEGSILGVK